MKKGRVNSTNLPATVPQTRQTLSRRFRTGSTANLSTTTRPSLGPSPRPSIRPAQSLTSLKGGRSKVDIQTTAKLERVLGSTACSSSISVDPTAGLVAYPASSTVVVQNPRAQAQAHFISSSKNNITCLAFSPNGRFLVTGEYGNEPMVRVWEIHKDGQKESFGQQVAELKGHSFGISCVRFTPDSNQVISVGNQHDKSITIWDWKNNRTLAESRVTSQVNAMDMGDTGKVIVTVGCRHVKFWHLDNDNKVLQGRSAILTEHRNNTFVDVCCASNNRTFTITVTKLLLELHDKKLVNTFELHHEIPRSICMGNGLLYMGFNNGTIRALNPDNMEEIAILPKPHNLRVELCEEKLSETVDLQCPDVHSIVYHEKSRTLSSFYSDRSIYHWQIGEDGQVFKLSSHLFHVGTVYDVEVVNVNNPYFPVGTFFTAGADETVRVWNVEKEQREGILPSNMFSCELRKIVYLGAAGYESLTEQPDKNFGAIASDMLDATNGIRCLKLNPLGEHLAVGSKNGNVSVLDLRTPEMSKIWECEAHDNEVRCLEYTDPRKCGGRHYLATGSRDRLIHIFDVNENYNYLAIIDDHQSSIYRILFIPSATGLEMVTCSNDKLIVVRRLNQTAPDTPPTFHRITQLNITGGPNYVVTTPENNLLAACGDRKLHSYSLNGKLIKSVKGTLCEEGNLTKLVLDPSGTYAATICSDRYVYIIDVATGECAAVLSGQSDTVASVTFTADCRRLILVSFSGCIFVWRLSNLLTKRMLAKLDQDRSTTPDSLIESGSDSASAIASKKEHHGSEFGSLNSLNVAQDDDLDSGVGLRQPNLCKVQADPNTTFSISRVNTEVIRRSSSNLAATSTGDLRPEAEQAPAMYQAGASVISPQVPQGYTTSRSMSNIHRTAVSPQRARRRWNVNPNETYDANSTYNYSNGTLPFPTQQNQIYAQPQLPPQQFNQSTPNSRYPQMHNSMSMNGIRQAVPQQDDGYLMSSTPKNSPQTNPYHQRVIDGQFDRNGRSRNSISKRYLNGSENQDGTTVWKPSQLKQRQPSNLFSPTRQSNLSPRRQSLTSSSSKSSSSRMYQPRVPNLNQSLNINESSPSRLASRVLKQRRTAVNEINQGSIEKYESSFSNMTASETLRALRSRSQSPSTLALQLAEQQSRKLSATLQRRRDSDARSGRATPSSSRANLRTQSNLGNSNQALNKLVEMRDQLKKSQDNLLLVADGPAGPQSSDGIMARSRSIGNLRMSAARPSPSINVDDGYYGSQRQMTRSVSSLHNTSTSPNSSDSPHPDENNLRSQYGNERRRSAMTASVRNLHKMSNPDLADEVFEENDKVEQFNGGSGAYYSATLPKNLRKGAVQKRLERSNPRLFTRLDQQTTSGDSDSNASDASPYNSVQQRAQLFQQRATPNGTQFRSVSSVTPNSRPIIARKGGNYLSRLNQPEEGREVEERNPIVELNEVDGISANAKNMSLHAQECIEQMTKCCDKLIQASQMIEKDGSITDAEREKILRPIYKAINQFKGRLESALPEGRTFSDMTNVTNAESGSYRGSGRPSNISNGSHHAQSAANSSAPLEINEDFFKTHGAKIMQFVQESMSRSN
ncbi:unnamed protein product [Bursaphelenchus xylophilus]|uniref:(pine wood nematode) hypothetical protein n=1 Tax=Bursaphelenchus xylophilus TaxID=6326 RepID=A0A811LYJ8_BURXY|nr:unnamed protein product [Bursaphelenchus xylophilus]CAG9124039.1 unnamed protein product [Bursaphelenchus xylophilus]